MCGEGSGENAPLVEIHGLYLVLHAATRHNDDAMAHIHEFRELRRNNNHGRTLFGKPMYQAINLGLGADIDATRWLIKDQNVRIREHPFADNEPLLIAARDGADWRFQIAAKPEPRGHFVGGAT